MDYARRVLDARSNSSGGGSPTPAESVPVSLVFLGILPLVLLVAPGAAATFAVAGLLWIAFLWSYVVAPARTLLVYIALAPVVMFLPEDFRLLPVVNFDTLVVPALAGAVLLLPRGEDEPTKNPLWAPVLSLVIVLILSAILSFGLGRAGVASKLYAWTYIAKNLKSIVLFQFLGPIAFRLLKTPGLARAAAYLIAGATVFISLDAILQLRSADPAALGGAVRAMNFWANEPNQLGGFLGLMFVLLLALSLGGGVSKLARLVLLASTVVTGVGLLLTFSRGAWLGVFAGLAYLAISRGARTVALFAILLAVVVPLIPQSAIDRANATFEEPQGTFATEEVSLHGPVQTRVNQWKEMPGLWIRSPLFGHGFLSFMTLTKGTKGRIYAPHSTIIALTVEEGLLGLAVYGWILFVLAKAAWTLKHKGEDPFMQALATALLAMIPCLVLMDCSDRKFFSVRVMAFVWIIGGAVARGASTIETAGPRTAAKRPHRIRQSRFAGGA